MVRLVGLVMKWVGLDGTVGGSCNEVDGVRWLDG